jgi:hypothetical protein
VTEFLEQPGHVEQEAVHGDAAALVLNGCHPQDELDG